MADKSLLEAESAAHANLQAEWKRAQAYDAVVGQKRNFTEWAEGRPSAGRFFPVGPVWEPMLVPNTLTNQLMMMNSFEWARSAGLGVAGYAVAAGALSNNYFRYTRVSTVASASALCCAMVGVYWGVVRAEMRIQGSIPNGKNLLPWMRGYKHDYVPRFMKQKSPLRVQASGGAMDAFLEDEQR